MSSFKMNLEAETEPKRIQNPKRPVVLFYAEWLKYFLIRSQPALHSSWQQKTMECVNMSRPQSLQDIGVID
jgi:hypothetical protein